MKNTKKQPKIFVRINIILIIIFFSCLVLTSCKNEHEDIDEIVTIVDAEILEINKDDKSFLVKGLGQNNILGDKSYVSTKGADYIEVVDGKTININFEDFSIGDEIIVDVVNVAESYPTQASTERVELTQRDNLKVLGAIVVGYSDSDKEAIFGDLNQEEINKIINEIMDEVNKDNKYEESIDLIIEKVFNENGIIDLDKINTAKSKITISIPK